MDGAEDENLPLPIDWQLGCGDMNDRVGRILAKQQWTDCSFLVGSEPPDEQKAHKLILAVSSPVFEAMFYGPMSEQDPYRIRVPDIEPGVFEDMLKFLYTNILNFDSDTELKELYLAAQKYMLPNLMKNIVALFSNTLDAANASDTYEFALFHDLKDLVTQCENMIMLNTTMVLNSYSFDVLKIETVLKIFSLETLNASELELIDAAKWWAQYNDNQPSASLIKTNTPQQQREASKAVISDPTPKRGKKRRRAKRGGISKIAKTQNSTDCHCGRKEEIVDRPILPLLHKIRFLTLTYKELCENKNVAAILTDKEMAAILNNAGADFGKNTLEMPEGFSTNRNPRKKYGEEGTLRLNILGISQLKRNLVQAKETFIGSLPWKISVNRNSGSESAPGESFGVFLHCVAPCPPEWSCFVVTKFKLLSHKPDVPDLCAYREFMFKTAIRGWGIDKLISWQELVNIESPYVKDGDISVEAHVVASSEIKALADDY